MREQAVRIAATGLLTSVGLDTASTAAALRCRLNCFERVRLADGEHTATTAPLPADGQTPASDAANLMGHWMARAALEACADLPALGLHALSAADLPVLACLAESQRPGRPSGWDQQVVDTFVRQFGRPGAGSRTFALGSVGLAHALAAAHELLYRHDAPAVLVAAADTYLLPDTLSALCHAGRCLGPGLPSGFVPGQAAGALLLTRLDEDTDAEQLLCTGVGFAQEAARLDNDLSNTGQGLTLALQRACLAAEQPIDGTDLVIADLSGEAFFAEEHALASLRAFQDCPASPALWLPAESLGNTGAASGLIALAWLLQAQQLDYAPGLNTLCQLQGDDGQRAAVALTWL